MTSRSHVTDKCKISIMIHVYVYGGCFYKRDVYLYNTEGRKIVWGGVVEVCHTHNPVIDALIILHWIYLAPIDVFQSSQKAGEIQQLSR